MKRTTSALLTFTLAAVLPACQPRSAPDPMPTAQLPWPVQDYQAAAEIGRQVYFLDPDLTRIDVLVRRDGPLARLGHDHVIGIRKAEGYFLRASDLADSIAELRFRADEMDVDASEARNVHQLDTEPDDEAVAATRTNLLDKVLAAEQWPYITLTLTNLSRRGNDYFAQAAIRIRGGESIHPVTFTLAARDQRVEIGGKITLEQTGIGLEPFSVLGGGLRVADTLEVHFRMQGVPLK